MTLFCLRTIFFSKNTVLSTLVLALFAPMSLLGIESVPRDSIIIESFSPGKGKEKRIPDGWRSSRSDLSMFSFGKEGNNSFTSVTSIHNCTSIGKIYSYLPEKYPYLRWKWRVKELPTGGSELKRDKNDSGAGVYVIFKGSFKSNPIIKYVWSSSLPVNTTTHSPYNRNVKIVVLKSGPEMSGRWITETVNVYDDYKRLFGSEPPQIEGFGLLTDSDNTESIASADYDDLVVIGQSTVVSAN